jgi:alpha-tubulin suppressor-like RCC1 family protein
MMGVRVRSVAAGSAHSLALGWDGRVYSWGSNDSGQLGHGDTLHRPSPAVTESLEGVLGIAAACGHSHAATHSGAVFSWGGALLDGAQSEPRPILLEGFDGLRVRGVFAGMSEAYAIGEAGELFSWGSDYVVILGHGDCQDQPSPKRVEALRDVRISSVSAGPWHVLALAEDRLVYAWGYNADGALYGNQHVENDELPQPIEALRGVRMGSVAAAGCRSYAVADTGELWAWRSDYTDGDEYSAPIGHGEEVACVSPKPIESLRGAKFLAVAGSDDQTLALAVNGSVYAWGNDTAAETGALGLGRAVSDAMQPVHTPQRV